MLYLETGQYDKALAALEKQEAENDLAENRYYKALVLKVMAETEDYQSQLLLAKKMYMEGKKMFDPYVEQMVKIYLSSIEKALAGEN